VRGEHGLSASSAGAGELAVREALNLRCIDTPTRTRRLDPAAAGAAFAFLQFFGYPGLSARAACRGRCRGRDARRTNAACGRRRFWCGGPRVQWYH